MSEETKKEATLTVEGQTLNLPIIEGTENEKAVDISALRKTTGYITIDDGFANTGSCCSKITYIDGEKGVLRYRGYAIEDLAENCTFTEVAYLLVHGKLPTETELNHFRDLMNEHALIHEDMRTFFRSYPKHAHPMVVLSAMVVSLSSFYPELDTAEKSEEIDITVSRLLSKVRTIAAFSYKKHVGEPFVYPHHDRSYCDNFLHMMFDSPVKRYETNPILVETLNKLLVLHADHEQNCSSTVVRSVGSAHANLYGCISAGICALWGPRHGGANQAVIEMLEKIMAEGLDIDRVIERAKDKKDPFLLMGFGHRVYKAYDPRARVAKECCKKVLKEMEMSKDPLLTLAMELEDRALNDSYFVERGLYPNIDFYTGIIYRVMGIPTNMYTVMFAMGRMPGWIAQWQEMHEVNSRIRRPRQIYMGPTKRAFVPIEQRM